MSIELMRLRHTLDVTSRFRVAGLRALGWGVSLLSIVAGRSIGISKI
jgi:hypothetical protein